MGEEEVRDRLPANQVFLDDALEVFWSAMSVPGAFRVDHGDGTLAAHTQTVDLRAVDASFDVDQLQLCQSLLQELPRGILVFGPRAVSAHTEKDVTLVVGQVQIGCNECQS